MRLAPSIARASAALLAAAVLAASGCGGATKKSSIPSGAPGSSTAATTATPITPEAKGPSRVPPGPGETKLGSKPKIGKPSGTPPSTLVKRDIVKGKGAEAKTGKTVSVQYVGIAYSTGSQFDASWDRGKKPFEFKLGAGMVIPGWDQGVVGMKVGGRRQLVIPPSLAYGANGQPPAIGPNETLVFDIDLLKVK
jgi:peptidylprolyl isomerase